MTMSAMPISAERVRNVNQHSPNLACFWCQHSLFRDSGRAKAGGAQAVETASWLRRDAEARCFTRIKTSPLAFHSTTGGHALAGGARNRVIGG
jgi:hypothetical protein